MSDFRLKHNFREEKNKPLLEKKDDKINKKKRIRIRKK